MPFKAGDEAPQKNYSKQNKNSGFKPDVFIVKFLKTRYKYSILYIMKRITLILIFSGLFFFGVGQKAAHAQQVTLSFDPPTQTVAAGSTFQVDVILNTNGQSIGSLNTTITYDGAVIEAQTTDVTGSIISIWYLNETTPANDTIQLSGNIPTPGVNGDNLHIATITFVATSPAASQIQFSNDTSVFRESDGTNLFIPGQSNLPSIITVSSALTPEPSGQITTSLTPEPTNITPTGLPDAGTTLPTYMLILLVVILAAGAVALLL